MEVIKIYVATSLFTRIVKKSEPIPNKMRNGVTHF
jgi:hypothetical protein